MAERRKDSANNWSVGTSFAKNYALILILLVLVAVFAGWYLFWDYDVEIPVCGDGTFYGNCSYRRPYFCAEGVLVERASVCGCANVSIISGDFCTSKYQTGPKNISLDYILRGEEGKMDFVVYSGMIDYISGLPKFISYDDDEKPSRADFKLRNINEVEQRELLLPLVTDIQNIAKDKMDQVRIAISLVQKISFGNSGEIVFVGPGQEVNYSRYPYEVLYDMQGVCGEKSELLAFLLREMGYEVVFFYHKPENHESLGVRCPKEYSLDRTGYCFVETTGHSIITDNKIEYVGGLILFSSPEVIPISDGDFLGKELYEYNDAKNWEDLRMNGEGVNPFKYFKRKSLVKKYGIGGVYNA